MGSVAGMSWLLVVPAGGNVAVLLPATVLAQSCPSLPPPPCYTPPLAVLVGMAAAKIHAITTSVAAALNDGTPIQSVIEAFQRAVDVHNAVAGGGPPRPELVEFLLPGQQTSTGPIAVSLDTIARYRGTYGSLPPPPLHAGGRPTAIGERLVSQAKWSGTSVYSPDALVSKSPGIRGTAALCRPPAVTAGGRGKGGKGNVRAQASGPTARHQYSLVKAPRQMWTGGKRADRDVRSRSRSPAAERSRSRERRTQRGSTFDRSSGQARNNKRETLIRPREPSCSPLSPHSPLHDPPVAPSRKKTPSPAMSGRSSSNGGIPGGETAPEGSTASHSPGPSGRHERSPSRTDVKQEPTLAPSSPSPSQSGSPPSWKKRRPDRRQIEAPPKKGGKKGHPIRGAKKRGGRDRAEKDAHAKAHRGRFNNKQWKRQSKGNKGKG